MRKLKILVLFDTDRDPPADQDYTHDLQHTDEVEFEVARFLKRRGHQVECFGFRDDIRPLCWRLGAGGVDVVYNLTERFADNGAMDVALAGLLELHKLPYTGAPPHGLALARDKAKTKAVLGSLGIPVPGYQVFPRGGSFEWSHLKFPVIVKPLDEDASVGVSRGSVVHSHRALERRVRRIHEKFNTHAIVEEFIVGREIYIAVIGDQTLTALPAVEMVFPKKIPPLQRFATFQAKWNLRYRNALGIRNTLARNLTPEQRERLADVALRTFRAAGLRDYGRIDIRLHADGTPYVLEANPNPYLAWGEDVANAAEKAGISYGKLVEQIAVWAAARGQPGPG